MNRDGQHLCLELEARTCREARLLLRGKAVGGAFMQGAVFGVIKVVSREDTSCCLFSVVFSLLLWSKIGLIGGFESLMLSEIQIKQRVDIFITVFVSIAPILRFRIVM